MARALQLAPPGPGNGPTPPTFDPQIQAALPKQGSKDARNTMRIQAAQILPPLRARAGEVDALSSKVAALHREAEQKAKIAEKLLNSKEFAAITAPAGTVVLATVFAAMEDLNRISGSSGSAQDELTKVKQLVQEDITILESYL